ncbi:MAG: transposase [Moraxellaceae bacterium]|nr:transposase [Moraxellaceae bacterium]
MGVKVDEARRIKPPFFAAVSLDEERHPQKMNLNVVDGFTLSEVSRWATQHLTPRSHVVSDGLACFSAVKTVGCTPYSHCDRWWF